MAKNDRRLPFIDALRGLAAFYVLVFHVILVPRPNVVMPTWLKPLLMNGGTGVTLFFVVSAFTLCFTMHGRPINRGTLYRFYVRRMCRILPLYYVWLLMMGLISQSWSWKRNLPCFALVFNFIPNLQEGVVWASWTIGVEIIFYVIFPFVFMFVQSIGRAAVFVVLCMLFAFVHDHLVRATFPAAWNPEKFIDCAFGHHLPVFAIGMLAFFLYRWFESHPNWSARTGRWLLAVGIAAFLFAPYLWADRSSGFLHLMAGIYACVLLGLASTPIQLIVNPLTGFLGLISYSVYLNHPQIVYFGGKFVYRYFAPLGEGSGLTLAACVLSTAVPLFLLSYITFRLIERPGIQLGQSWLEARRRPVVPATSGL